MRARPFPRQVITFIIQNDEEEYFIILFTCRFFLLGGCRQDDFVSPEGNVRERELVFRLEVPDMREVSTRNVDSDGYGIQSLTLLCFDRDGSYLSRVEVKPEELR